MKITKFEHACLVVEEQGQKLIIDPGVYSTSFTDVKGITAVVVTHVHGDHLDIDKLRAIYTENANAKFYAPQQVLDEVKGAVPMTAVKNGDTKDVSPFKLEFFGKDHSIIHETLPIFQNVGVMVNDILYYPGDSFTIPHKPVQLLALPAGAPWSKVSEEIDFLLAIKPKQAFPTHNAMLSDIGMNGRNNWFTKFASTIATEYTMLKPGDSLSI